MTLHITYDHACPECKASYIPYGKDVRCPCCGFLEQERFESFVQQAAHSALYNYQFGRHYTPIAWGCFSFADKILFLLFNLLDAYCEKGNGHSFETFTTQFVSEATFADCEYLRAYIAVLALEVYKDIQSRKKKA